jgi:hypothetical protein
MVLTLWRRAPGRVLGVLALAVAGLGLVMPDASGVAPSRPSSGSEGAAPARQARPFRSVVRVERHFTVAPHSLATNQLVACPRRTRLVGGGTSLVGEPSRPSTAPVLYTNGPVGTILPGATQTWGSEVANASGETFEYVQFALCVSSRRAP